MRLGRHHNPLLAVVLVLNVLSVLVVPSSVVAQDRPTLTYFALGDSYASGHGLLGENGNGEEGPGEEGNCRRSSLAYPYLVGSALVAAAWTVDLQHLACSGATAGPYNMKSTDKDFHPDKSIGHQFETVTAFLDERQRAGTSDPVLITITIGANDIGLTDWWTRGQIIGRITTAAGLFNWLDEKSTSIASHLTPGIDDLLSYEGVYIILTDYPNPFPDGWLGGDDCTDFLFDVSCEEAMKYTVARLNRVVTEQFVRVNQPDRLHVVSLGDIFASHPASGSFVDCAAGISYPEDTWFQKDCAHPNMLGAEAIADVLVKRVRKMLPDPATITPTPAQGDDWAPIHLGAPFGPGGHEIGAVFTVTTTDGVYLGTCTLEGDPAEPGLLHCEVNAPPDTDVVVLLDVNTISPGTLPGRNPVIFRTPSASDSWPGSVYFHSVSKEWCENGDDPEAIECILDPEQFPNSSAHDPDYAPRYYLPWESGSVWQITAGNGEGEHSSPDNSYGFDAVPVPGQGTDKVVAIGEGTVFDFQESMPDTEIPNGSHAGNCVIILHDSGDYSLYAHLAQDSVPLTKGQHVPAGTVIGTMGNSGYSMGPHLHWALMDTAWMYTDADVSPYRTCAGTTIESYYFDDDPVLAEDGYVPRTGRSYTSSNGIAEPVQSPPPTEEPLATTDIPSTEEAPVSTETVTATSVPDRSDGWAPMDFGAYGPDGHAIGARFTVATEDGSVLGSCTLEGDAAAPELLSCQVDVPTHTPIVVTLDADTIPPGYTPVENPIAIDTGAYPGEHPWGVFFELVAQDSTEGDSGPPDATMEPGSEGTVTPMPTDATDVALIDIGASGPNGHEIGAHFTVTTEDGEFLGSCTLEGNAGEPYPLSCRVSVPRHTTVVVTLDVDTITPGYAPVENPLYFDTSSDPGAASHWGVFFQIEPEEGTNEDVSVEIGSGGPVDSTENPGESGAVDIALITRDPAGDLLTGACYVLVDYSNEGCDENGDGQVTFADIPFGTYTVHQTRTPAGYPSIDDYEIEVAPTGYMEGPSFGAPLGFIVRQAPEQNAPNTRNVSVVFLDMVTHERVPGGGCVELLGASIVGCDRDLVDGQVDFLDVPAGGPYELSFSQLPPGTEVATVGGPLAVTIDARPGSPANVTIFVLLAGAAGGGGATDAGSTTITPSDNDASDRVQVPDSTSGDAEATLRITFRGCPEGFDPDTDDFSADCTIPLDAPDASIIIWGGDGQGGMSITALDREYNGAYTFTAGPGSMDLQLWKLAPVVRDAYQVIGADDVSGDVVTIDLVDGETRDVFIYYYFSPDGSRSGARQNGYDGMVGAWQGKRRTITLYPDGSGVISNRLDAFANEIAFTFVAYPTLRR